MDHQADRGIKILIAEDSPTQREQLRFLLESHGFEVFAAPDGRTALEHLRQHRPALVISDVVMPELDGYGLCRAIKNDVTLKHIPVMLVTTLSDPQDVLRGLDCGADNFVRKPYDAKYLLSRIDYLLMNVELRQSQRMQMALEIHLGGNKHLITAERQQILDLLVSTYEQAVQVNDELKQRENDLAHSNLVLQGLNHIAAGLNSVMCEREVAETALERALALPGVRAGWIFLKDSPGFHLAASAGLPPDMRASEVFAGGCGCLKRLAEGVFDSSANITECDRFVRARKSEGEPCCHATVPLWLGEDRILGVMNLLGTGKGVFSDEELKVLFNVGNQVAVALERARLHQNLETLVEQRTAKLAAEIAERERLQKEQARLLDSMYEGAYGVDTDGRLTFVNQSFLRLLAYPDANEVLGRRAHELIHHSRADGSPYPANECRTLAAHREHRPSHVDDEVFWRKDGVPLPVEYWSHPIEQDGEEIGAIATFIDITERKQAEAALVQLNQDLERRVEERTADLERARQDADDANRAKSAFLATMSHEIRTPMNGVLGMLEVLEHGNLSEHQRDQVQTMRDSAATLLALIDDILDFSKIEAGRIELEQAPLSVADLVEGLCTSQLSVAHRRGVALRMFVDPDLPERVLGDDTRLRQVLYNLVGNAIKFSAGNPARPGRVTVRATLAAHAPSWIVFTIEDNGIGMDEAAQARLFTPFTQAEASTTRRFGGTGLGLTICRRLVNLMGGEIGVDSRPGEGSVFTVKLPLALAPKQPLREQPDLSGLRCFLLGDIDAEALSRYLEHAGATVRRCTDVEEAMRFAAAADAPAVLIHADAESRRWRGGDLPAHLRCVRIGQGRRRRARLAAPDCVSIDGDALRRQTFLRVVAVAAGRASPEIFDGRATDALSGESTPPPTVAQARAENRLILVAEDDSVNQKVVLQQLALLGYAAEVAGDGSEALARWEDGGFALLFTDLHMPAIDGYQLATEIRRREGGGRRMPIIALTANALRGEAARASAAGMDDYLTKPVTLARLRQVLEAWLPRGAAAFTAGPARALDVAVLQRLVGDDDPAILHKFLSEYAHTAARAAAELHAAAAAKDHGQVAFIAHKLKSSSRSVGALPLGDLCAELENAGKRSDGPAVERCMAQFETLITEVEMELVPLLSEEKLT